MENDVTDTKYDPIFDEVISYEHHGVRVLVRKCLKGLHRRYSLCWSCKLFFPDDRVRNCEIADRLYQLCERYGLVTPVWECKFYEPPGTSGTSGDLLDLTTKREN